MCSGVLLDLLLFVCLDNWFNLISLHSNNLSFTTTQIFLFCFWFCSAVQFMLLSQTHHQHLFQQQKQHYHRSPSPLSDLIVEFHLSKKVNFVWLTWCVTSRPALDLQRHVEAEIIAVVIVALKGFIILIVERTGAAGGGGQIQGNQVVLLDGRTGWRRLRRGQRW